MKQARGCPIFALSRTCRLRPCHTNEAQIGNGMPDTIKNSECSFRVSFSIHSGFTGPYRVSFGVEFVRGFSGPFISLASTFWHPINQSPLRTLYDSSARTTNTQGLATAIGSTYSLPTASHRSTRAAKQKQVAGRDGRGHG